MLGVQYFGVVIGVLGTFLASLHALGQALAFAPTLFAAPIPNPERAARFAFTPPSSVQPDRAPMISPATRPTKSVYPAGVPALIFSQVSEPSEQPATRLVYLQSAAIAAHRQGLKMAGTPGSAVVHGTQRRRGWRAPIASAKRRRTAKVLQTASILQPGIGTEQRPLTQRRSVGEMIHQKIAGY